MSNDASNFLKNEILRQERILFIIKIFTGAVGYSVISLWLNAIRATASIWFVWILIVIQFAFYFSIFIASHQYSKICGLNKIFSYVLFITLAVLGRVNDWELFIIPALVITMLFCAVKNENLSDKGKSLLPENSKL